MSQSVDIPLGPLDRQTPDRMAPDGTLRTLENLVPRGRGDQVYYKPYAPASKLTDLSGILAIGRQVRQRRGNRHTTNTSAPLERLVAITDSDLQLLDPAGGTGLTAYTFGSTETSRQAQMAQVGERMVVATATGAGTGEPEELLVLVDDEAYTYQLPAPDPNVISASLKAAIISGAGAGPGLMPGTYALRMALELIDGSVGPATGPVILEYDGPFGGAGHGTTNADISAGDTEFTCGGQVPYGTALKLQRDAKNIGQDDWDAMQVFVEDERVRYADVSYDSSATETTFTLASDEEFGSAHSSGVDIEIVRPAAITLTLSSGLGLDATFAKDVKGVAVILTPIEESEQAFDQPYFQVETISTDPSDSKEWQDSRLAINGYPSYEEGGLTAHEIRAAAAEVYNSRLLLGDVEYDYQKPRPVLDSSSGGTAGTIRVSVVIDVHNGQFERFSDEIGVASTSSVGFRDDLITYPDARVEKVRIWLKNSSGDYELANEKQARASEVANLSYVKYTGNASLSPDTSTVADVSGKNAETDRDPNRLLVSETHQPQNLKAREALYLGNAADDEIRAIAANTHPVSQGQFGQYPLFVFCKESVWAMQPGEGEVTFAQRSPVTVRRGVLGRDATYPLGRRIAFLAQDGLYLVGESLTGPVSEPLHEEGGQGFLADISAEASIGRFTGSDTDREELWVAMGGQVYGYSLRHQRWFELTIDRDDFTELGATLYSQDGASIYEEGAGSGTVPVVWETSPIHLGTRGVRKRVKRVGIRMDSPEKLTIRLVEQTGQELASGELVPEYYERPINLQRGHMRDAYLRVEGEVSSTTQFESMDLVYTVLQRTRPRVY